MKAKTAGQQEDQAQQGCGPPAGVGSRSWWSRGNMGRKGSYIACKAPSRSTSNLLGCSRCITSFLQNPSSAQPQLLHPTPGQRQLPPEPHFSRFLHTHTTWSCSRPSRSPANRYTCGPCNADPRHTSLSQLQLLQLVREVMQVVKKLVAQYHQKCHEATNLED